MRRLPVVTLAVLATGALCLSAALGSTQRRAATAVVFQLVPATPATCKPPQVVLGSACATATGLVLQDKWIVEPNSANWNVPGQWEAEYQWTVPDKVPATGAKLTLKLIATELIGGTNNRICPAMGTTGFSFKESPVQPVTFGFCAEAGGTKSGSRSLTMVPSTAAGVGETVYVTIGLQDGPRYVYTYKSVAASTQPAGSKARPGAKRECTTIYAVVPTFQKLQANVKLTELSAMEKADLLGKETRKYEGHPYTPIGPMTRKQNCAGYVVERLFGSQMVEANVEPDAFYRKVVVKFGSQRDSRLSARAGDVVVYRTGNGVVKHVAIVESNLDRLTILSKDGNERLYRAKFPLPGLSSFDPLVQAHADDGTVEFWHVDTSKVKLSVGSSNCDK